MSLLEGNYEIFLQPYSMTALLLILCAYGWISKTKYVIIWNTDFRHRTSARIPLLKTFMILVFISLKKSSNKSLWNWPMLPLPQQNWEHTMENQLIAEQHNYNQGEQVRLAEDHIPLLNPEQRSAFDKIVEAE